MTTIEAIRAQLVATASVTALVGSNPSRIYPQVAPQAVARPFVVLQVISDVPASHLNGAPTLTNARLQVDCYGQSYLSARAVAEAVDAVLVALVAHDLSAVRLNLVDSFEDETELHRISGDYSIWRTP